MMKNILIILSTLLLFGCAETTDNIIRDKYVNNSNNGYLIVGLESDWNTSGNSLLSTVVLQYVGDKRKNLNDYRKIVYRGKDNKYIVVELPADKYRIVDQYISNRYLKLYQNKSFKIFPRTITYIGDISSNIDMGIIRWHYNIKVDDNFKEAKKYLNNHYSKLLSSNQINKQIISLSKGKAKIIYYDLPPIHLMPMFK